MRVFSLFMLTASLCACLVHGRVAEGTDFPRTVTIEDRVLSLRGAGIFKWKRLLKVYASALYVPADTAADEVLGDTPRRLVFVYYRDIRGTDFAKAANPLLAANLSEEELAGIADRVARLHAMYEDIAAGDRYDLTYVPGQGTALAKNGWLIGTIPGADFAALYFRIWLGEHPLSADLRNRLLGR